MPSGYYAFGSYGMNANEITVLMADTRKYPKGSKLWHALCPVCEDIENGRNVQLILTVVVDEDGVDGIEDTLAELAEETEPRADNSLSSIRQALKRLINRQDAKGTPYFYDRIEVLSAKDFKNRISCT